MKFQQFPRGTLEALYAVHQGRSFYDVLIELYDFGTYCCFSH